MKYLLLVLSCMLIACQAISVKPHFADGVMDASFIQDPVATTATTDTTATTTPAAAAATTTAAPTTTTVTTTCSATNPCKNDGTCANGVCTCKTGFSGTMCEVDPCASTLCDRFSKCEMGKCVPDPCGRINCLNGGTCNGGTCTCVNNFGGLFCQDHPCNKVNCLNGGICREPGQCHCLNGFSGQFCEVSPCANVVCLNGGKCLYGTCVCMPEWSGSKCDRPSEAARDFNVYKQTIDQAMANVTSITERMQVVHNTSSPTAISNVVRSLIREIQDKVHTDALEASKRDFMTPKVIGVRPVTHKDMRMPNTPMENAKIYEDRDLAYQKAREVRDKRLLSAMDLVGKYDEARVATKTVLAMPVPFEENMPSPFGSLASVTEKYVPVDGSLLDADLEAWRAEKQRVQDFIMN